MTHGKKILVGFCLILISSATAAEAARIKDIAGIGGVRQNQLVGYGLAVGLMGTGDNVLNGFTRETMANMLTRHGMFMKDRVTTIKAKNVAAVMVTANLPAFAKNGNKIDCTVSSMGDATSLQGGTLIMTPLRAPDGEIYAVCQGPLVIGGASASGPGASAVKNATNVGLVPNGALVEREVLTGMGNIRSVTVNLYNPDFTTARETAARVNAAMGGQVTASARDSATVNVEIKEAYLEHVMEVVAELENVDVPVTTPAVVVMNEKTGTVVMGENVRISTVAISHGNLSITIKETASVSQPLPFAPGVPGATGPLPPAGAGAATVTPGAATVVTRDTTATIAEEKRQLMMVPRGVTIQEVVQSLNAIGVTPRDLITILQTIKAAGALQAELRII